MKRRTLLQTALGAIPALGLTSALKGNPILTALADIAEGSGPFKTNWNSLEQYNVPDCVMPNTYRAQIATLLKSQTHNE